MIIIFIKLTKSRIIIIIIFIKLTKSIKIIIFIKITRSITIIIMIKIFLKFIGSLKCNRITSFRQENRFRIN